MEVKHKMKIEVISKFNVCIDIVKGIVLKPKQISDVIDSQRIKYLLNNKFLKLIEESKEAKIEKEIVKEELEPVKVDVEEKTIITSPLKIKQKRVNKKQNIFMEDE